jgi:hypothetical protein
MTVDSILTTVNWSVFFSRVVDLGVVSDLDGDDVYSFGNVNRTCEWCKDAIN